MDISEKEETTYSIKEGDIFLTRTSETLDELGMSSIATKDYPKASYSGFLKRIRPVKIGITYPKYMAFYLRSKLFRQTMNNNAIMTLRASFNEQIFSYLELILPEYSEQKKIGDLLYAINQKIELNNRINAELEGMAKLIYDYWFVQFDFPDANGKPYKTSGGKMVWNSELKREIPEGWEAKKMNKFATIASGYSFKSESYQTLGSFKIITIKNVQDNKLDTSKIDYIEFMPKDLPQVCQLEIGDYLMSLTGNVGRICIVHEKNLLLNQRVGKLTGQKYLLNYFYFLLRRPEERLRLEKIATGSSQKNLSPVDAMKSLFCLPSFEKANSFNTIVNPIIDKIILNSKENQKLTELRDWLLPMLMNGQVRVK